MKPSKKKKVPIQHLVPNNPQADQQLTGGNDWDAKAEAQARKKTLYDNIRSGYYITNAGHWKQRDEPDEAEQFRQSDRIQQIPRAQRQKASRERLKTKNAVPTRKGKKLFDEFMLEANTHRPSKEKHNINFRNLNDMKNAYNAASALAFDQWVVFVNDLFDGRI